jgi:hypothetical protein
MKLYKKLPGDFLIRYYNEIIKKIEKGILSKNMYYELGIIIFVANWRGISLNQPSDFNEVVNQQVLNDLLQSEQVKTWGSSHIA